MYSDRQHIALKAPQGSTGCELGVASGGLTKRFLDLGHFSEFHAVDKWDDAHNEQEYLRTVEYLKDFPEVMIWRLEAKEWLKTIPDGSLGFVYIDCYAHTGQDNGSIIKAAWPKLAIGGLFSGDDYDARKWPKTVRAVDDFAASQRRRVHVYDDHLNNRELARSQYDNSPSWYFHK